MIETLITQLDIIAFVYFIFYELRRKRRGSMTPHQCWNVCDWKTTERDQPSETQLSLPRAHIESQAQKKGKNTIVPQAHHV